MIKIQDSSLISDILKTTSESVIAIDLNKKILFWNNAAENLFGYKQKEVLGKSLPFITSHSQFELDHIINSTKEKQSTQFRTQKKNKNNEILDLIFTTNPIINQKQEIIGASIIIQNTKQYKRICYLALDHELIIREQKRTFDQIRNLILATITKEKTINQISNDSRINWRTVEKHLTYLIGKKLVKEVFSSEYVRIFELTNLGKTYVEKIKQECINKIIK